MKLRPRLVPTLTTGVCLVILVGLGTWQLRRNTETNGKIAAFAARLDAPALKEEELNRSPADLWHRQASVRGEFRDEPTFLVGRADGVRAGYGIVQVLDLPDGRGILVDRGWVAHPRLDEGLAALETTATEAGVLLPLEGANLRSLPEQDGIPERWPTGSGAAMARQVEGTLIPALLVAGEELHPSKRSDPDTLIVKRWWVRPDTRPHLEYAATWFAIALVLLWVWGLASRVPEETA
jgi:surfeit locus 1 family protein